MSKIILSLFLLLGLSTFTFAQDQIYHLRLWSNDSKEQHILDQLNTSTQPTDLKIIDQSIKTINEHLYQKGYLNLQYSRSISNDTLLYNYILNQPIKTVILSNQDLNKEDRSLLSIQEPNQTIEFEKLNVILNNYTQLLDAKGLGTSTLILTKHNIKGDTLFCNLQLQIETTRLLNKVVLVSEQKLPEQVIQKSIKRFINKPYSEELVNRLNETISNIDLITTHKSSETLFTENNTLLYLYLNKRKNNTFDGFGGFYTDKQNKVHLTGQLNLELNNAFNAGEALRINWQSDANKQTQLDLAGSFIYLFQSPINLDVNLNLQKQDTTFQNTKLNLLLGYSLSYSQKIQLGYQNNNSASNSDLPTVKNYTGYFYTLNYFTHKKRNRLLAFPINYEVAINLGTGKRSIEDETAISQQMLQIELVKNFMFNTKNYFYIRWQYKALFSDTFLTNEVFRFGGNQSLRGFQENSLLANQYHLINTEYRLLLHPNFYLSTLFDYALQEYKPMEQKNSLYSFGFSLGFLTNSNHFKLSLANGKQPNNPVSFDNTMIHISFKTLF